MIKKTPNPAPICEVMRVARRMFPCNCHRIARNTRPPSSGNAGMILNATRMPLIQASSANTPLTATGHPSAVPARYAAKHTAEMTTLAIGPAMAIQNSALALGGSSPISATPPKMNSVMPFICIPNRRATSECDSSCSTIDTNSPSMPAAPMIQ